MDFLKKVVIIQWNASKKLLLLTKELIEEVSDPSNAKEYYESFLRKKNKKSVKNQK